MALGKFTDEDKKKLYKFLKSKGYLSKEDVEKYDAEYGLKEKSAAFKQGFMDMMRKIAAEGPKVGPIQDLADNGGAKGSPTLADGTPSVYDDESAMPEALDTFNKGVTSYLGENAGIHTPIQASTIAKNVLATEPIIAKQPYPRMVGDLLLQRGVDALPDPGEGVRQPTPYELAEYMRTLTDRVSNEDKIEVPGNGQPEQTWAAGGGVYHHEPSHETYRTWPTLEALRTAFTPLLRTFPGYTKQNNAEDQDDYLSDVLDSEASTAALMSILHADPKLQDEFARRAWNTATSAVPISVTSAGRVPSAASN